MPARDKRPRRGDPIQGEIEKPPANESERLSRLVRAFRLAVGLFGGNVAAARRWLTRPCRALGGATPLDMTRTEVGAREVEDLVGRLGYGVFP